MEIVESGKAVFERAKLIASVGLAAGALALGASNADASPVDHAPQAQQSRANPDTDPLKPYETGQDTPGQLNNGAYYYWVGAFQKMDGPGASVSLAQTDPVLGPNDYHSAAELDVISPDSKQQVEFGWNFTQGDTEPTLFASPWIDGQWGGCLADGCGFVPLPGSSIQLGDAVTAGTSATYEIQQTGEEWLLSYNGQPVGYYPDSIWGNNFTRLGGARAFGEVASASVNDPTAQMGNGIFGSAPGAAAINNFVGLPSARSLNCIPQSNIMPYASYPAFYDYGSVTPDSLTFGGAGGVAPITPTEPITMPLSGGTSPASWPQRKDGMITYEMRNCEPAAETDMQNLAARIDTREAHNPSLAVGGGVKIPLAGHNFALLTENSGSNLPDGRPNPVAVDSIRIQQYGKHGMNKARLISSIIFKQASSGEWDGFYRGNNGYLRNIEYIGVKPPREYRYLLEAARQAIGLKPGQVHYRTP